MTKSAQNRGFTLVELLVAIAIIAILAAIIVLIINPDQLTKRARDAARLSDLANLQSAINVAVQEVTSSGTSTILCVGGLSGSSPQACTGKSNTVAATIRNSDGTGWVKVNLSSSVAVSMPTLPIDPINNSVNHYTYCSDGNNWEIDTVLESTQQSPKMPSDGGDNGAYYEVGSKLTLVTVNTNCPFQ